MATGAATMTPGLVVHTGPDSGPPSIATRDGDAIGYLSRPRLLAMTQGDWRVLEVRAGPGFGKTAFVTQWTRDLGCGVGWLQLEPRHNDARVMADALCTSTEGRSPGDVLVLDDADRVASRASWALVETLGEQYRLVLLSRRPAGMRLARWRTQGKVRTILADDLRFTLRETYTLLGTHLRTRLNSDQIRVLWTITRGWAAGLALATVAERQVRGATRFDDRHWRYWDRLVDDYFVEEVLEPLPEELRHIVLQTADLPYLSEDLGVPGLDRATLQRLKAEVALLDVDDFEPGWYRYDPLLAATLRRQAWLAQPHEWPPASRREIVQQLIDIDRVRAAADLAQQLGDRDVFIAALLKLGPHLELMSYFDEMITWLDFVPLQQRFGRPDLHHSRPLAHPDLDYWWMLGRLGLGRTFGVAERLRQVEAEWLAEESPLYAGRLHLLHGMLAFHEGNGSGATRRLAAARVTLPESAPMEHLYSATLEGNQFMRDGRDDLAEEPLGVAERIVRNQSIQGRWGWRTVASDRANTYALRGDLLSAVTKYELMLAEMPAEMPDVEGFLRCRLLAIQLERNQLDDARKNFERIEDLLGTERQRWRNGPELVRIQALLKDYRRVDSTDWQHDAAIARLRLMLAEGQVEEAEHWGGNYLKLVRHLPQKVQIVLMLAGVWLDRREGPMVESWLRDLGPAYWPWARTFGDINPLLLAIDLQLARGNVDAARRQAKEFVTEAADHLRWAEYVAGSMRLAIAHDLASDAGGARQALRDAARVGVPGGFVRAFQVPGWQVELRFAAWWSDLSLPRGQGQVSEGADSGLLTAREIEVLELVAAGMSNKQIATTLFISVNTVRNHLVRISRRLEAGSRTEVVARARGLGLLG